MALFGNFAEMKVGSVQKDSLLFMLFKYSLLSVEDSFLLGETLCSEVLL